MSNENKLLAILFADIANSTRFYEVLGNEAARQMVGDCIAVLGQAAVDHGGTVIKTIGDEIMCTFPIADSAVEAAMAMNRNIASMPFKDAQGTLPLNIYVGIHSGPVIEEYHDVFGDAVNVAAHLVGLAKQRQIITTEETVRTLNPDHGNAASHIEDTMIKGKAGKLRIYEIMWEHKDETVMLDATLIAKTVEARMELRFEDQLLEIGPDHPYATLGRQDHNDLVVDDIRVSRTHARIEYRRGKFILIDQSTNGTYGIIKGGQEFKLKRDETFLWGNGVLSLGRRMESESSEKKPMLTYKIRSG